METNTTASQEVPTEVKPKSSSMKTLITLFNVGVPFGLGGLFLLFIMVAGMAGGSSLTDETYMSPIVEGIFGNFLVWMILLVSFPALGVFNAVIAKKGQHVLGMILTFGASFVFLLSCTLIFNVVSA